MFVCIVNLIADWREISLGIFRLTSLKSSLLLYSPVHHHGSHDVPVMCHDAQCECRMPSYSQITRRRQCLYVANAELFDIDVSIRAIPNMGEGRSRQIIVLCVAVAFAHGTRQHRKKYLNGPNDRRPPLSTGRPASARPSVRLRQHHESSRNGCR